MRITVRLIRMGVVQVKSYSDRCPKVQADPGGTYGDQKESLSFGVISPTSKTRKKMHLQYNTMQKWFI